MMCVSGRPGQLQSRAPRLQLHWDHGLALHEHNRGAQHPSSLTRCQNTLQAFGTNPRCIAVSVRRRNPHRHQLGSFELPTYMASRRVLGKLSRVARGDPAPSIKSDCFNLFYASSVVRLASHPAGCRGCPHCSAMQRTVSTSTHPQSCHAADLKGLASPSQATHQATPSPFHSARCRGCPLCATAVHSTGAMPTRALTSATSPSTKPPTSTTIGATITDAGRVLLHGVHDLPLDPQVLPRTPRQCVCTPRTPRLHCGVAGADWCSGLVSQQLVSLQCHRAPLVLYNSCLCTSNTVS